MNKLLKLIGYILLSLGIAYLVVQFTVPKPQNIDEQGLFDRLYSSIVVDLVNYMDKRFGEVEDNLGGTNTSFVSGKIYQLSGSGINSSATSVTLTSFTDRSGKVSLGMEHFGDVGYLTVAPNNSSKTELISFTGITQNADGSATLTGVSRGLEFVTPYTASSTLQQSHAGGTLAIISDPPQLFNEALFADNDATVSGLFTFNTVLPTSSLNATTSTQLTTKDYVDSVANQGAATSTETNGGIVELATQIEMASTTDGGADVPRALYTKYSTSSPDIRGLYAIISENDGYLNQGWLDLTEGFNFTGTFGIGTSTPWGNVGIDHGAGEIALAIGSSTATSLVVDADGNLGLGTTTPSIRLSVVGGALFDSSGITFDDGTTQTTAAITPIYTIARVSTSTELVANSQTVYTSFNTSDSWQASEMRGFTITHDANITDFRIYTGTIGASGGTATVRVNGSDTALSISIADANDNTALSDTDTVSVSAGDRITIKVVASGANQVEIATYSLEVAPQ